MSSLASISICIRNHLPQGCNGDFASGLSDVAVQAARPGTNSKLTPS